ncbi:MAG: LysE family transporter [Deltaproteobacteria bacterium]|nr:LysE family transporter [Deltaproteobacteria bacterium]
MGGFVTAGVLLGLSAGLSPGPLLALVLSQTLRYGAWEGAKSAAAPLVTDLPIVTGCLLMLTQVAASRAGLGAVSLGGAIFLAFTAYQTATAGPPEGEGSRAAPRSLLKGAAVNALSPHPYLFWLTVGGPTLLRAWERGWLCATAFAVGFFGCLVGSKVAVAAAAGRSRRFFTGRAYAWLMRALGAALLVFAALLLREGLMLLGAIT